MMHPFAQTWRLRAECLHDLSHIVSADWHRAKINLTSIMAAKFSEGLPDVVVSLHITAYDGDALRAGLEKIVEQLRKQPDTHVMIESLKPSSTYDGKRNGSFALTP